MANTDTAADLKALAGRVDKLEKDLSDAETTISVLQGEIETLKAERAAAAPDSLVQRVDNLERHARGEAADKGPQPGADMRFVYPVDGGKPERVPKAEAEKRLKGGKFVDSPAKVKK